MILDNVKYAKGGWVNRNRILVQGQEAWLSVPVGADGDNIADKVCILDNRFFHRITGTVSRNYPRGQRLLDFLGMVRTWEESGMVKVSEVNLFFLKEISKKLGIVFPSVEWASSLRDSGQVGQERIINLAHSLGATTYVNLSGGEDLYDPRKFEEKGIELSFVRSEFPAYQQRSDTFIPKLSVLDFFLNEQADTDRWFGPEAYSIRSPRSGT